MISFIIFLLSSRRYEKPFFIQSRYLLDICLDETIEPHPSNATWTKKEKKKLFVYHQMWALCELHEIFSLVFSKFSHKKNRKNCTQHASLLCFFLVTESVSHRCRLPGDVKHNLLLHPLLDLNPYRWKKFNFECENLFLKNFLTLNYRFRKFSTSYFFLNPSFKLPVKWVFSFPVTVLVLYFLKMSILKCDMWRNEKFYHKNLIK